MSCAHACATRNRLPQPGWRTGVENPYPGSEGTTTWNASAGSPPCEPGSASGPITRRNSTGELGQPWVSSSGSAPGWGDRTCRKWIGWPSIVVMNCGIWLSAASAARQSKVVCQYPARSRT